MRALWQAGTEMPVAHSGGNGEGAGPAAAALERGEGSLAGGQLGRGVWALEGARSAPWPAEGVRAGEGAAPSELAGVRVGEGAAPGELAGAGLATGECPAMSFAGPEAADLPALSAGGAESPPFQAFLTERGRFLSDSLAAFARGLDAQAPAGALASAAGGLRGEAKAPRTAGGAQERVHEWGREFEREGPSGGQARGRSGAHEPSRTPPEGPLDRALARAAVFVDAPMPGLGAEARRGAQTTDDVERAFRDGARRGENAPAADALVVHDVRRCPVRRLRFEVDASFRDARVSFGLEFDDASYERATLERAGSELLGRASEAGHGAAMQSVAALLRAFATGAELAFPVALEPAFAAPAGAPQGRRTSGRAAPA